MSTTSNKNDEVVDANEYIQIFSSNGRVQHFLKTEDKEESRWEQGQRKPQLCNSATSQMVIVLLFKHENHQTVLLGLVSDNIFSIDF